jgi:hypothetical protein
MLTAVMVRTRVYLRAYLRIRGNGFKGATPGSIIKGSSTDFADCADGGRRGGIREFREWGEEERRCFSSQVCSRN